MTPSSTMSLLSFLATAALARELRNFGLEGTAALGVVLEHVEGRAGRGQQHDIAGLGQGTSLENGVTERRGALEVDRRLQEPK